MRALAGPASLFPAWRQQRWLSGWALESPGDPLACKPAAFAVGRGPAEALRPRTAPGVRGGPLSLTALCLNSRGECPKRQRAR